ncbi:MAG TPA: MotA/TolQ/ExbB proton channel family protein [Steroidobacter sp.]|uniref:MotA/TolQ/ExbB proton channel family protein n=1 Tax=Steroidobacter sp. TaxID=1978227 RepID=UPI002EDA68E3
MAGDTEQVDNPFGFWAFLRQADELSYAILIILVAMSLACWFVILTKLWDQRSIGKDFQQAQKKFWSAGSLHDGLATLSGSDNVFRMLAEDGIRASHYHQGHLTEKVALNDWLAVALHRSIESVSARLSGGLAILATTGSVSPFIGLLGTVWGILNALTGISLSGNPSLEQIAGPIGEALIMTAIGLFVAVPAVMGYNWLLRRNKALQEKMRVFAADVHSYLVGGARFDTAAPLARRAAPTPKPT